MYLQVEQGQVAPRMVERPAGLSPQGKAQAALSQVRQALTRFTPELSCDPVSLQADLAVTLPDPAAEIERFFALGWTRWLSGDWVRAEVLLAAAQQRAQEQGDKELLAESAYWLARVRLLLGTHALEEYEKVLRQLGGSPQATAWFVDLLWRSGRVDRAEQVWKSVRSNRRVTACPETPIFEARLLLWRGQIPPAERILRTAGTSTSDPAASSEPGADAPTPSTTPHTSNGVVWVERQLLLVWIQASQRRFEQARKTLAEMYGPFPARALETWRMLLALRRGERVEEAWEQGSRGADVLSSFSPASSTLTDLIQGQQARSEGRVDDAVNAYRAALAVPAVAPFAHYGLACLGQEDFASLLASQPGLFLAVRCRARLMRERFRQRQATPSEFLDVLQMPGVASYHSSTTEHFRQLALILQRGARGDVTPEMLRSLVARQEQEEGGDPAVRNRFRIALELAVSRLPANASLELLLEWANNPEQAAVVPDSQLLAEQLLRCLLRARTERGESREGRASTSGLGPKRMVEARPSFNVKLGPPVSPPLEKTLLPERVPTCLSTIANLDPQQPTLPLLRATFLSQQQTPTESPTQLAESPGSQTRQLQLAVLDLWEAARTLGEESTLQKLQNLRSGELAESRLRGLAQALLLQRAAQQGDVDEVVRLLADVDPWRTFRQGPPTFVLRAVERLVNAHPTQGGLRGDVVVKGSRRAEPTQDPQTGCSTHLDTTTGTGPRGGLAPPGPPVRGWKRCLEPWLRLWDPETLGPVGATLAVHAGLEGPSDADILEPPQGVSAVAWLGHQAVRALGRDNPVQAWRLAQRALAILSETENPEQRTPEEREQEEILRTALPDLEQRAQAKRLAMLSAPEGKANPEALSDLVALLAEHSEGKAVLQQENAEEMRTQLDTLSTSTTLSPSLAHHLALLQQRAALGHEEAQQHSQALECWSRAWHCWLQLLGSLDTSPGGSGGAKPPRGPSPGGSGGAKPPRGPSPGGSGGAKPPRGPVSEMGPSGQPLLDELFRHHRQQINQLLARNAVDVARGYWTLVQELPHRVDPASPDVPSPGRKALQADLGDRAEQFRDQLATEYLLSTRDAMRHGTIPEGWRGDYETALTHLCRFLSMDKAPGDLPDSSTNEPPVRNVRLLTALVEICGEWFLDLYNCSDLGGLRDQVERFTPFALQLARLAPGGSGGAKPPRGPVNEQAGTVPARAALSEFYKFRGFVARSLEEKASLYREALQFNPANENVQELLADLEEGEE